MSDPLGLTQDQRDVSGLVDDLLEAVDRDGGWGAVEARSRLVEAGLWTVGVPEALGGGGADEVTTALVLSRVARFDGGLAWACAQLHAAAAAGRLDDGAIAVVDLEAGGRTDTVGGPPEVLVALDGDDVSVVVGADRLSFEPWATTGFDGCTGGRVSGDLTSGDRIAGAGDAVRRALVVGALSVAAGLTGAAADLAERYARGRVQFGDSLVAIPVVRMMLESQRAAARELLAAVLAVGPAGLGDLAADTVIAQERAIEACASAVQSHGGYGYIAEYPVEAILRDAISLRAASPAARIAGRLAEARYGVG